MTDDTPKTTVQGAATQLSEQDFTARVQAIMQEVKALAVDGIVALRQTGKKRTPYEAIPKERVEAKQPFQEKIVVIPAGRWLAYRLTHDPALMATLKLHRGDEKRWEQVLPVVITKCEAFYQGESGQSSIYQKLSDNVRTIIAARFSQCAKDLGQALLAALDDSTRNQTLENFRTKYFITPQDRRDRRMGISTETTLIGRARHELGALLLQFIQATEVGSGVNAQKQAFALRLQREEPEFPTGILEDILKGKKVAPQYMLRIMLVVWGINYTMKDDLCTLGIVNKKLAIQCPPTPTLENLMQAMDTAAELLLPSPREARSAADDLTQKLVAFSKQLRVGQGR